MSGVAPLSFGTIQSWTELMGLNLAPYQVDALLTLDNALMTSYDTKKGDGDKEDAVVSQERGREFTPWPDSKKEA